MCLFLPEGGEGAMGIPPHLSKPLLYITVLKTLIYVIIHVKLFVVKYFFYFVINVFSWKIFRF